MSDVNRDNRNQFSRRYFDQTTDRWICMNGSRHIAWKRCHYSYICFGEYCYLIWCRVVSSISFHSFPFHFMDVRSMQFFSGTTFHFILFCWYYIMSHLSKIWQIYHSFRYFFLPFSLQSFFSFLLQSYTVWCSFLAKNTEIM